MKKRIIAMILVVVMSVLALASCGYSIAEDDLTKYASFSDAQKAAFEKILKEIVIEDGTFGSAENAEQREAMVWDSIYSALKNDIDTKNEELRKTEGTVGARDLLYYAYYCTAEIEVGEGENKTTETKYFYTSNMKASSPASIQLGAWGSKTDDYLVRKYTELLKDVVFGKEEGQYKAYEAITDSTLTVSEGDVVYVTYEFSYTETNAAGVEVKKTGKVTNGAMVVGAKPAEGEAVKSLASYLNGQKINTTLTKTTIEEEGKGAVEYTNVKIDWKADGTHLGGENGSFKHSPFKNSASEKVEVTDINGNKYDLKDKELTYYVYPVYYYEVAEYTAENIMNIILGKNISETNLIRLLFGSEYDGIHVDHEGHDHDDDDFTEEEKEKMEKLEELLKKYSFKDGDETLDLEEIAEKIADLQSKFDTAETKLNTEKSDLEKAQKAYDDAKKVVDDAGDKATQAQKDTLSAKEKALNTAKEDLEKAQKDFDEAKQNRDEKVKLFLEHASHSGKEGGISEELTVGYKRSTYDSLQASYNSAIKMSLATEVLYFLNKNITVTGTPEKTVDDMYDQIYQNYQYEFYKSTTTVSGTTVTNYKKYNGDFKAFLVAEVTTDIKKVADFKEAKAAIRERAEEYVEPIVMIYVAARAYGVLVDDDAFKAYKEDIEGNYSYHVYSYGEDGARYVHQFDELMNYFLESEEDKGEANEEGIAVIKDKYERVTFTFGEKSGSALDKEALEKEEAEEK